MQTLAVPIYHTLITLSILAVGCSSDSKFSGGARSAAPSTTSAVEAADTEDSTASAGGAPEELPAESAAPAEIVACDDSKAGQKPKFPENIQACVDTAHIFNFYTNSCSPVAAATSFKCTFEDLKKVLSALGIATGSIDAAIKGNAKLVGCGEKRAGKSIITQWWFPSTDQLNKNDCTYTAETAVTTGCFQQELNDGTITNGKTPEERAEIIKKCLE